MLAWLRRPSALLGIAALILSLLIVAAIALTRSQAADEAWVRHTLVVENRLSTLLSRAQDAETGERGYLLTNDDQFLEPYVRSLAIQNDIEALADDIRDNPRQMNAVARLRPLFRERMDSLGAAIQARRNGIASTATLAASERRGKQLMDEARRVIAGMDDEEERLLAMRQQAAAANRVGLDWVLVMGLVGIIALTTFAIREINLRYRALQDSFETLGKTNERLVAEGEARQQAESKVLQMQKMEAIGQLTGGIAHDFNNMLSIIIGSLELARRRLVSAPDQAFACIDNAMEGATRAAQLTGRLLAFSRQQALAPIPLDPNKLVGGMSELLHRTIGEHLDVETVLGAGVWRVNVDPQQLENIVLNLCVNARDAMPDGGRLTIETSNAFLDDDYAAAHVEVTAGQYVLISVTDTGIGMGPEVVARAFEPFYTTKGVGRGTGLGLSQVLGFVKQSGGHVKIYSEVGRGTSVKIYLPRFFGEAADRQPSESASERPRARDHEIVLLVEDEEKVRHVTVDSLRELGYTVVQASSGEAALQQLRLQPTIDLLLTDVVMPGMTGRALAEAVRAEKPELKVLYMTGYTRNAIVHNGVLDAGVAFLQKPFTAGQLATKVRQVLDGQGANRPVSAP